jgi:hypothetical protein
MPKMAKDDCLFKEISGEIDQVIHAGTVCLF